MDKKLVFLLSFMLFVPFLLNCENDILQYGGQSEGQVFSFSLPKGWEKIPLNAKDPDHEELTKQLNKLATQYAAAFQRQSDRQYFDYPYLLVQIQTKVGSLEELKKGVIEQKGKLFGKDIPDPIIDKTIKCLVIEMSKAPNVHTVMVLFPGKYNTVGLNFYSKQFEKDEDDFKFIVNSFSFLEGYEYIGESPFFKNIDWAKVIAAVIIGFFLVWYTKWKRKKKNPYNPIDKDR